MKKIFNVLLLIFMLMPFSVKAEINLVEVHNNISEDNKLTVQSIPLEYYKNSKYYKTWEERSGEEWATKVLYSNIVESYVRKNYNIPTGVIMFVSCNVENSVCDIELLMDNNIRSMEQYDVEFVGEYDEKIYNMAEKTINKIKSDYKVDDMAYINQLINFNGIIGFHKEVQQSSKILKMFPELKKELEENTEINFYAIPGEGGSPPTSYGLSGSVVAYHNDMAIGIAPITYTTYKIVYISNETENSIDAYIEEALKRINEYINNEDYNVSIVYEKEFAEEICGPNGYSDWCKVDGVSPLIVKIKINEEENILGIVPTDEKNINKLKVESKDYKNGISVETESSDVPIDTSVEVDDVTHKHKGFLKAYEIQLYSGIKDEYISRVKDGIIVRIPLEDNCDKEFVDIYHIKDDGEKGDKYNAKVEEIDGKKYAIFTTNHFSVYAIENFNEEIENPSTYDGIINDIILLMISLIGLISLIIYFKKHLYKLI